MSEKIYAWMLLLYPASFREAHGEEALQLFRDRARHERGFLPTFGLWVDLLVDFAISLPREYGYDRPVLAGAGAYGRSHGVPSFFILREKLPRVDALFSGSVISLAALAAVWILLGYPGNYAGAGIASGQSMGSSPYAPREAPRTGPEDIASANSNSAPADWSLNAAERQRVIEGAIANLKAHYVDRDVAQEMAEALRKHQQRGDDDLPMDGGAFARLLTSQMRDVAHDMHLVMVYSREPLPDHPVEATPEVLARYRAELQQDNCTFKRVEILPGNIGYLKFDSFPDPSICRSTAAAAMASLNRADAIIFDLRDNRGGEPAMVMLIAAYLFDHPEYMYNPRENTTEKSWTPSPVPGSKLADKPVYILTSGSTYSAAEHFCYDLKMLKRATLVGETTGGGAHSGVWHRIDEHFGMGIPETKAINPFSKTDWAEVGVEPDVHAKAEDALEAATKLAKGRLQEK
ncbi:MAG: S41 family peptidase [Candidatus Acidiferrum sp.]